MVGTNAMLVDAAGPSNHKASYEVGIQLLLGTLIVCVVVAYPIDNLRVHYLYLVDIVGTC